MAKLIGACLIALPFVAVGYDIWGRVGMLGVLHVSGYTIAIAACIAVGVWLMA